MRTTARPKNRREQLQSVLRSPGTLVSRTTRGVVSRVVRSAFNPQQKHQPPRWG